MISNDHSQAHWLLLRIFSSYDQLLLLVFLVTRKFFFSCCHQADIAEPWGKSHRNLIYIIFFARLCLPCRLFVIVSYHHWYHCLGLWLMSYVTLVSHDSWYCWILHQPKDSLGSYTFGHFLLCCCFWWTLSNKLFIECIRLNHWTEGQRDYDETMPTSLLTRPRQRTLQWEKSNHHHTPPVCVISITNIVCFTVLMWQPLSDWNFKQIKYLIFCLSAQKTDLKTHAVTQFE